MQRGALRERGIGLRPALAQHRQHAMAQEVAVAIGVDVARILDPCQRVRLRIGKQLRAWYVEPRSPQPALSEPPPGAHRGESVAAGSAQRAQQEGLGLVVAMMGEREDLVLTQSGSEGRMPRSARCGLEAVAAIQRDVDADDRQRQGKLVAQGLAVRCPAIGIRVQAVVHVERAQAACLRHRRARQGMQQHAGIETAAEPNDNRARGPVGQGHLDAAGQRLAHAPMLPRRRDAAIHGWVPWQRS